MRRHLTNWRGRLKKELKFKIYEYLYNAYSSDDEFYTDTIDGIGEVTMSTVSGMCIGLGYIQEVIHQRCNIKDVRSLEDQEIDTLLPELYKIRPKLNHAGHNNTKHNFWFPTRDKKSRAELIRKVLANSEYAHLIFRDQQTLDDWLEEEHHKYLAMIDESGMPPWLIETYY